MDLYPAIDLLDGRVVRLHQGDYDRTTIYQGDPVALAGSYQDAGASWVHVVDLDAARGRGGNRALVAEVATAVDIPVQTGGGIRTLEDAEVLIGHGVQRLVVGTAAFRSPGFVDRLCSRHPGRVAVDIGVAADGRVVVQGWQEVVDVKFEDALERFSCSGVSAFVVTSVSQDGTLEGPDLVALRLAVAGTDVPVLASGGVGTLDDLRSLTGLGVAGVIVGRALFEGRFTLEQALAACR